MFCWKQSYIFVADVPVTAHDGAKTSPEQNREDFSNYFSEIIGDNKEINK